MEPAHNTPPASNDSSYSKGKGEDADYIASANAFLDSAAESGKDFNSESVSVDIAKIVLILKGNPLVKRLADKWNALSFEEQKNAVHLDQSVLSRLLEVIKSVAVDKGFNLGEVQAGFIKAMLFYGVIEFSHGGSAEDHEALIKELHLGDRNFVQWGAKLLSGAGYFLPEVKPLAEVISRAEHLLKEHGDFSDQVRLEVRRQVAAVEKDVDTNQMAA